MNSKILTTAVCTLAAAGVVTGTSIALAAGPTTMPVGASDLPAAQVIQQQVKASAMNKGAANSYFYLSNGGGQVSLSKETDPSGYKAMRTITITPPDGSSFSNAFATVSGGQAGVLQVSSTSLTAKKYTIKIAYPGDNGTPGKLTFRLELLNG